MNHWLLGFNPQDCHREKNRWGALGRKEFSLNLSYYIPIPEFFLISPSSGEEYAISCF